MAISVFAFHKNNRTTFGGKRQNDEKKFGGKRQNDKKNLVENGKTLIFAVNLLSHEQRKHTF